MSDNLFLDGLMGLAVGDALGVPYEFSTRDRMQAQPCTGMVGHGSHNQPAGSWSDDTSMALCTADSLAECGGFDADDMMGRFCEWMQHAAYTAADVVFDMGVSCATSLLIYQRSTEYISPMACGGTFENSNGNGSLMRILPMSLYQVLTCPYDPADLEALLGPIHDVSAMTHAHPRSLICCGLWTVILAEWLHRAPEDTLHDVIVRGFERALAWYGVQGGDLAAEAARSDLYIHPDKLSRFTADDLQSGGYVIDSLQSALWCLLTTDNYADCVLRAVNLGHDTDTTAAIAGGLAGVVYGLEGIPQEWRGTVLRADMIADIARRLQASLTH